ncbi:hypothetical protein ACWGIB_15610 [Streptomyces xiamenensis]
MIRGVLVGSVGLATVITAVVVGSRIHAERAAEEAARQELIDLGAVTVEYWVDSTSRGSALSWLELGERPESFNRRFPASVYTLAMPGDRVRVSVSGPGANVSCSITLDDGLVVEKTAEGEVVCETVARDRADRTR